MQEYPWTECFDFYFSEWQRAPLMLLVDLGAGDVAPLRTHPVRLQARVPMARAKEDGLRDAAEGPSLFALEDALCQKMGTVAPLLFVGRVVGLGEVTFIWYAPAVIDRLMSPLAQAARAAAEGLSVDSAEAPVPAIPYSVSLSQSEDPDWSFYFDFLYPDVYNLQVMLNRRRLLTLLDHGDDGARPRALEHHVRFPSLKAAQVSARALRQAGFDVDGLDGLDGLAEPSPGIEPSPPAAPPTDRDALGEQAGNLEIWFSREDALTDGRIDDVCVEILDAVLPEQGDYEGWASPIVPGS